MSFGVLILASSCEESKHYSQWVGTTESQEYHPCNLKKKKDQNSNRDKYTKYYYQKLKLLKKNMYLYAEYWSEFLVTDPEVPGVIPGATRF
jgi:hypothetical protein